MLSNIVSVLIESKIIIFFILIGFIFLAIFLFLNWQVIWSLKTSNYNNVSDDLDVERFNEDLKPFGFAYDIDKDIFLSIMYPWQREYGYYRPYDEASTLLSMIIDCEPIYFEYDNRNWLIEFWKGQYGMTTGGEIGVYVSKQITYEDNILGNNTFYYSVSDNERIPMFFTLKKKNKVLITRKELHWWLTGFKLGEFSKPSQLVMDIEITLANETMRNAFVMGLKEAGYEDKYIKILDNTVYLTFNKPHTNQPIMKNSLITLIMQNYNKNNCKFYNLVTRKYKNSLDKINFIRREFPLLYDLIINFKTPEKIFESYKPNSKKI